MKKREIISNICFVLIVIALIVIMIYQKNPKVLVYAISAVLFLYGLSTVVKQNVLGYISICLGASLLVSGTLYFTGVFNLFKSFTFMLCSSVFLLMAIVLIFAYIKRKLIKEAYELVVEATVVDLIPNENTRAKYYQPYYKYQVDDHDYSVLFPVFINKHIPKIGDRVLIRVDKEDHQNVYFEKEKMEVIIDVASIVLLLVLSFIVAIKQFF